MSEIRPERGTKRVCQSCSARFYDLGREHPVCPKCGAEYVEIVRPAPAQSRIRKWGAFGKGAAAVAPGADEGGAFPADVAPEDGDREPDDDLPDDDADDGPDDGTGPDSGEEFEA